MQRTVLGLMGLLVVGFAGCKPGTPAVAPDATATPAAAASPGRPAVHPCALLTDASIASAVAGAQPGQRDAGDEGQGITTCRWSVGDGAVVMQVFDVGPGALPRELRSSTMEVADIRRPDAATLVRLEHFEGIGEMAGAYVERTDATRGIRRSNAVLMVQRGDRLAVLRIPQIAEGDRDEALAVLKGLGTTIAIGL